MTSLVLDEQARPITVGDSNTGPTVLLFATLSCQVPSKTDDPRLNMLTILVLVPQLQTGDIFPCKVLTSDIFHPRLKMSFLLLPTSQWQTSEIFSCQLQTSKIFRYLSLAQHFH